MVSTSDPAVQSFIAHSMILALKMLIMSLMTVKERFVKKAFASPEDVIFVRGWRVREDPDVERVRRAHLNDLENIPLFFVVGAMYLTTGPAASTAASLFRMYTAGRVLHTLVYAVKPLPQPARAIAFELSNLTCIYMTFVTLWHYYSWL